MEERISIIALWVRDLEQSFNFYIKGLGLPTRGKVEEWIINFLLIWALVIPPAVMYLTAWSKDRKDN